MSDHPGNASDRRPGPAGGKGLRRRQQEELERARAAHRARRELLAAVSGELRGPATAILAFSDLLMQPHLSPREQGEFLKVIRGNGKALLARIDKILEFLQIEAGHTTPEIGDCDLQRLINDLVALVALPAEQKRLTLGVDWEFPCPERIRTDPQRLRQILANLLDNAVKFTACGRIRIAVRCLQSGPGPARMQFAVSDTGIGIAAERTAELFRPFALGGAFAAGCPAGTGLGLAIGKRLANALGGDLEVCSKQGEGSTFTVTIEAGDLEGVPLLREVRVAWDDYAAAPPENQRPSLPALLDAGILDAATLGRLVVSFREDLPRRTDILKNAWQAQDLEVVAEVACQLQGMAGVYGLSELAQAAAALHESAVQGNPSTLSSAIAVMLRRVGELALP